MMRMQVKTPCDSCKNDRVLAAMDNEGLYIICRGCFKEREVGNEERESLKHIINYNSIINQDLEKEEGNIII